MTPILVPFYSIFTFFGVFLPYKNIYFNLSITLYLRKITEDELQKLCIGMCDFKVLHVWEARWPNGLCTGLRIERF